MDVFLVLVLFVVCAIVGWYDHYAVQRTYADLYADRYGRIPPLIGWAFEKDPDAEVDYWRRLHRNLYVLVTVLAIAMVAIVLVRASTWT